MFNEDSNSGFELLSSQGERKSFSKVPENTLFNIKVFGEVKSQKIGYKLMEGTDLPCTKIVGGTFCSRCPSVYFKLF